MSAAQDEDMAKSVSKQSVPDKARRYVSKGSDGSAISAKFSTPNRGPPYEELAEAESTCLKGSKYVKAHDLTGGEGGDEGGHGHGHGPRPHSLVTACASAMINYLLMFGLCCAYGMIMFYDPHNRKHVGLGVKMNLSTAFICGLMLAIFSKVPVAIGGPDLNPVVFIGGFVSTMAPKIAEELELEYPEESRRLMSRMLGGGGKEDAWFCKDYHLKAHPEECDEYHERLAATVIFSVTVSSALLGLVYFLLGRLRLTRLVSYVPTSVMEAFLSCVGYKVFNYALKFCDYELRQFIPAACVGVPLYFLKAYHVGNPAVVMPLGLLMPLGLFYLVCYGFLGSDIEHARANNFFFPELPPVDFWEVWTKGIVKYDKISFKAWQATIPELIIMLIVCMLDCLLKISSTESKLPVKCQKDYEIQLHGVSNVGTVLCGSSVGYMQLKFNVINYGVMGNVTDRRGGIIYALLCGVSFFGPIQHFDYLPRMFLAALLFFAGSGFVAENLWGSRRFLSLPEWMEILLILIVFIVSKSLLYAVIVGGFITGISFIVKYAKVPSIRGRPLFGSEIVTSHRREELNGTAMRHILGEWSLVVKLKGYLFFASAHALTRYLIQAVEKEEQDNVPEYRRLRYVILDCELLDGMDASAAKALKKLIGDLAHARIRLLWAAVVPQLAREMVTRGVITDKRDANILPKIEHAVMIVEKEAQEYMKRLQAVWLQLHPAFERAHMMLQETAASDPFTSVFRSDASRFGCPWKYCSRITIKKFVTCLWKAGESKRFLFLIHSGAVGLFPNEEKGEIQNWAAPTAVLRRGRFLNSECLVRARHHCTAVALEDGEVIYWDEDQLHTLTRKRPLMMSQLQRTAIGQQMQDNEEVHRARPDEEHHDDDDDDIQRTGSVLDKLTYQGFREQQDHLPAQLQFQLDLLESASAIAKLGFYSSVDEIFMRPQLPPRMVSDAYIAFNTYAVTSDSGAKYLPVDKLRETLIYAGFYNAFLKGSHQLEQGKAGLDVYEFMDLLHEVVMAPLSKEHVSGIQKLFTDFDADKSGMLQSDELVRVFRGSFHEAMSIEAVDGIALAWHRHQKADEGQFDDETQTHVNMDDFISVMSRYVRKHEPHWDLFRGISEVMGVDECKAGGKLTLKQLLQNNYVELSEEQATEMLWAADWSAGGAQEGKAIDMHCLLTQVLLVLENDRHAPKLPPPPCLEAGKDLSRLLRAHCGEAKGAGSLPTPSPLIVDFRSEDNFLSGLVELDLLKKQADDNDEGNDGTRTMNSARRSASQSARDLLDGTQMIGSRWLPDPEAGLSWRLYTVLEEPNSSKVASIWSMFMGVLILVSVLTLILHPMLEDSTDPDGWQYLEYFFAVIFTIEFILRLVVAPHSGKSRVKFLTEPSNVCDFFAIVPTYIDVALGEGSQEMRLLRVVRLLRLSRMARVARLANKSTLAAPVAMVLVVIWGIYMKHGL